MLPLSPDQLLTTTRAVRRRLDFERPVELALVKECLEIALQAPTGSNAQGWHFVVVTDPAKRLGLAELYRRAWAVTSASIAEGWGMTLTEAAACGTPSVATRIAGHEDAVVHGQTGLLADSTAEFTEQLVALLTDRQLRERLGEGARKHAATFTWDATAVGVFSALARDAIRRKRRRPSSQ